MEYLKEPPSKKELDAVLRMLDMEPREWMRSKEKEYVELGLKDQSLSRDQLIAAMVEHRAISRRPRLARKPIPR